MAEFNRINPNTSRSEAVGGMVKSVKNALDSPLTQFIEGSQPMKTYWYHIDQNASYTGLGFNDTAGSYDGGIKYICIKDYVAYGYPDDRAIDVEKGEHLDVRYKLDSLQLLHRPNTLRPLPGDLMSFDIEQHQYLYKVISSAPVTFNNKSFIKTIVEKDSVKNANYYLQDFINDKLITRVLEYDENIALYGNGNGIGNAMANPTRIGGIGDPNSNVSSNGGSKASPFVQVGYKEALKKLLTYKNDILEDFNALYYMENKNIYVTPDREHAGFLHYTPLLVDIQMEFRPLWTFGINTILTHETILSKKSRYKLNLLRKFLKKTPNSWEKLKTNGLTFSTYEYMQNIYSPMYKIESYFNDNKKYYIYDYYHGDNYLYDRDGNVVAEIDNSTTIMIPDRYLELFEKYANNTLELSYLENFLDSYEFNESFVDMLMTLTVLCIIDSTIHGLNKLNSVGL